MFIVNVSTINTSNIEMPFLLPQPSSADSEYF